MRHIKLMLATVAILALALTGCAKLQARDNLNKGVRAFRDAFPVGVLKTTTRTENLRSRRSKTF